MNTRISVVPVAVVILKPVPGVWSHGLSFPFLYKSNKCRFESKLRGKANWGKIFIDFWPFNN